MVSLGEYPAEPARQAAELDPYGCLPPGWERSFRRDVALQGDTVQKVVLDTGHFGGGSVGAVGGHEHAPPVGMSTGTDGNMIAAAFNAFEALPLLECYARVDCSLG